MKTRRIMLTTALVSLGGVLLYGGVYGGHGSATPAAPGQTTTILAKSTLDSLHIRAHAEPPEGHHGKGWRLQLKTRGLTDAYVVDNKFAPGADTGWHSHPGPSIVFVVAGTMTNYSSDASGCAPQVYATGSSFIDQGGDDSHLLRNEGTVPAETIAFQMIPNAATRRIDEPVPPGC